MGVERAVRQWRVVASALCYAVVLAGAPFGRAASQGAAAPAVATAVIAGFVKDTSGVPLGGAEVSTGPSITTTTGPRGTFRLVGVERGTVTLTIRRLGFRPSVTQWDVDGDSLTLNFQLSRVPAELPIVHVTARAQPFDGRLAGFNQRRQHAIGYYITRDQIEKRSDHVVTDALREVPGIRLRNLPGGGREAYVSGSRCAAVVFVDGFPATAGRLSQGGGFDLNGIDLDAVEGIEVYPNAATMPSEFMAPGGDEQCGVVAIWLSPMRPRVRSDAAPHYDETDDVSKLIAARQVFVADSVDEQASLVDGTANVTYPDSLFRAGVGAKLLASFVVDTIGEVELPTLEVKGTPKPAPAFVSAIRAALGRSSFRPARRGGQAVRQVVVLPFLFDPKAVQPDHAATSPAAGAGIPWESM